MNKLCPYFQKPGYGEDVLSEWPALAGLFMDIDGKFVAELRQKFPRLRIVVRLYEEESHGWRKIAPEDWAARFAAIKPDYAISWTMPLGQDNGDLFAEFDDWSVRFAEAVRAHDIEPVGLCVGTGNFTGADDRIKVSDAFPGICQNYDVLGPQDYGWPTLQSQIPWHALRWTKWHDDIKEAFGKEMLFAPMECGITQAVLEGRPDVGWQTYDDGVTDESYLDTMRQYNERLCELSYVKYAFVYIFHGYGDWTTFDHINKPQVWHVMKDFDASGPEPPSPDPELPPDNNGGDNVDTIRVVDMEYKERDLAWAESKYGVAFKRAKVAPGQKVYRLVELWEKTGHSSLVTQVLNEQGQPMAGVDVAFYWQDAPGQPAYAHDWHKNFVHGKTNVNGDVGPGMGPGAYHGEGEGGPHAVWVRDPDIPSDICEKLGMLAGTNHDHLDQKFKLEVEDEGPGPTPPSGEGKWEEVEGGRAFQPQGNNRIVIVAQGERDFYDTRASIGVKGSDWEAGPFMPETITKYVLTADYNPNEDEESRTFWATIEDCEGKVIGGPFEFKFRTGEHGWWTTLVEWREGTPEPSPPTDGDAGKMVRATAKLMADYARDGAARSALLATELDKLAGG